MTEPQLVEDAWLSARLGKPAFHLVGDHARLRCLSGTLHALGGRTFADAKIAVDQQPAIRLLLEHGFVLAETSLQLTLPQRGTACSLTDDVGFAKPDMEEAVGAIAEDAFVCDRFHRDPLISKGAADAIKRDWARGFFNGQRGDWMVVACRNGVPVGFLLLIRSPQEELIIDLIAVDAGHRRQRLAEQMITFAATHCGPGGPILVGTQIINLASVRLYENLGFRMTSAQYVFHRHGTAGC